MNNLSPLDELLKTKRNKLKRLNTAYKRAEKARNRMQMNEIQVEISEVKRYLSQFSKSNMDPRQVGDIVINYKLYVRFLKKLKDFKVWHELEEDQLVVSYKKSGYRGNLHLHDIRNQFPAGSKFLKGELLGR